MVPEVGCRTGPEGRVKMILGLAMALAMIVSVEVMLYIDNGW
jgi:hypothetical protein